MSAWANMFGRCAWKQVHCSIVESDAAWMENSLDEKFPPPVSRWREPRAERQPLTLITAGVC